MVKEAEENVENRIVYMSFTQKCIAYAFGFFDLFLHTMLIFGWSAFTELYKKENYYRYKMLHKIEIFFLQAGLRSR